MPLNYDQSKLYKIWSPQGDKIYIGSTTKELLCQRMTAHRKDYTKWKNGNLHQDIALLTCPGFYFGLNKNKNI